ncbi:nudix hydrolase homolog 3 [Wolffia australiana]
MAEEECFDVLTRTGEKTGVAKPRSLVHRDGDYHRAVHVWIYAESTGELLLQRRADCKDSWPGLWDISSAGHISAGSSSLLTARRELEEELGISLPEDAFELLFVFLQESVLNEGTFINNEFNDVYLVTTLEPIPLEAFTLQETEVSAVRYISLEEYKGCLCREDEAYVPYEISGEYGQLFDIIERRYQVDEEQRCLSLQKKLSRYAPIHLHAELLGLSEANQEALIFIIKAATIIDDIFYRQVWKCNQELRDWLKKSSDHSTLNKLKWMYYSINKGPWSVLDEKMAFLTTADSAIKLNSDCTKPVPGWKGLEYKASFPLRKSLGASFYPSDMEKAEFELWKRNLSKEDQKAAAGYFSVIRRRGELSRDSASGLSKANPDDLVMVPFSEQYRPLLDEASTLLRKAAELSDCLSLRKLLIGKADALLSNDYYDSDISWMELDSKLDITIGPYETYEDELYGYKATFEAFIGIRDDVATAQVKLFGDSLQTLERNLPLDDKYKSENVVAAPIRVIRLVYNSGDVKGPQTVAFNLPNDERIVSRWGTSMVMLKNISEAKFQHILQPIADVCIEVGQRELIDFDSFYIHTLCHECCHGIGPHLITPPSGQKSTVRMELQELHSAIEEAKADIVGLWAVKFLMNQGLISRNFEKSMYVSFLAGCFRSVRFGLNEAHGKGQALQFNWLIEKRAFISLPNGKFCVDFDKVEAAVEGLSREILSIQANGDKTAAEALLRQYAVLSQPLKSALKELENIQVPVDIVPTFSFPDKIMNGLR